MALWICQPSVAFPVCNSCLYHSGFMVTVMSRGTVRVKSANEGDDTSKLSATDVCSVQDER